MGLADGNRLTNPYMFTGRRFDIETGLYYYRARYYKPDIGRFLQTDPIGYKGGMNLYAYVGNNPIVRVDPYGLCYRNSWGAARAANHFFTAGGGTVHFRKNSSFSRWVASRSDAYATAEHHIGLEVEKAARNIANPNKSVPLNMGGSSSAGYGFNRSWLDIKGIGTLNLGRDDAYSDFTYNLSGTVSVQDGIIKVSGTIEYEIWDLYTYEDKNDYVQRLGDEFWTHITFERPFEMEINGGD